MRGRNGQIPYIWCGAGKRCNSLFMVTHERDSGHSDEIGGRGDQKGNFAGLVIYLLDGSKYTPLPNS